MAASAYASLLTSPAIRFKPSRPPLQVMNRLPAHPFSAISFSNPLNREPPPSLHGFRQFHGLSKPRSFNPLAKQPLAKHSNSKRPPASIPVARTPTSNEILSLGIAVAIPLVLGLIDSLVNSANSNWYKNLRKPTWSPPDWVFAAAWTVLYVVMGLASWLIWVEGGWGLQAYPLTVYLVQLILCLMWPIIFFGANEVGLALFDLVALSISIVACIVAFKAVNPLAAYLLYPYLAWVAFATALNYAYWKLNADSTGVSRSKKV